MGGGGKGGTSTSTVSIPPEVLARYNAVNARAEDVAKTPFQAYGGEFVAPMNTVQQQGVSQTQQYSGAAQPYYQQAAGLTQQAVDATKPLSAEQIQQYQNPYVQSVVDPTLKALQQQQAVDRQNQATQAIRSGAFGGERAGLQRAALSGQQELAQAQAISPLYAQAYQQAVSTAQQQQQQRAQGLMGAGQQIAGIGTGAQQAGLQGAQAVIGAGTLGQQTQQALDTAQYQQFLQERGYPFQTAQFLANIAEGTGALSGSTTTTTQPTSFFSDERLKHDIKKIGKTNDGLPIYSFKYNGDDRTQIGLMAQDVEKKRPEAVGLAGGYKTVDYAKATAGARHARAVGGLIPSSIGGAVFEPGAYNRGGYAGGGLIADPNDLQAILAAQRQAFGPFAAGGLYGSSAQQSPISGQSTIVPPPNLPVPKLVTSSYKPQQQQAGLKTAMQDISAAGQAAKTLSEGYDATKRGLFGKPAVVDPQTGKVTQKETTGLLGSGDKYDPSKGWFGGDAPQESARGGGIMPRDHYAGGGFLDPYKSPTSGSMVPEDVMQSSEETKDESEKLQPKSSGMGGSGGGGSGLGTALGVAKTAFDVGKFIIPFFLKDGGVVPRQAFGGDDPGGAVEQPQYKVQPIEIADMEPHQQQMLKEIYGPESGGRYDIRYGGAGSSGKTFDINAGHPNVPERREDGRTSTAAGAGQFLKSTWDEVTGGAPMSPGYQNAATWALAQRDYNRRTGRDLNADLKESGVTPEIKAALAPTWESFAKQGAAPQRQAQQQPQQGGVKPWYDKMAPQTYAGEDRTMGQFLGSKDFIIPLLTGLGTMASSPSRYLGAAILQGLGGGAQAYASLQKQQADIQGTEAGTQAVLANIAKGAGVYGPSGQLMGFRVYVNGKVTQVPPTEFMRALRAGRPYQVAPDVGGFGGTPQPAPPAAPDLTKSGGLGQAAQEGQAGAPAATQPPATAPAPYRALTPEDQELVKNNADAVMTSNPEKIGKDATAYADAANGASNSMINRQRSLAYAKSLSELPAKGVVSANAFSAEVATPFVEYVNGLIHSIPGGGDINIVKPEDLANAEVIRKISGLQANAQTSQSGQHAYGALMQALQTTPTQRNTPLGAAGLMADILMQEQLPIDYYKHLDMMKNYAQQKGLVTGEDQAKMLGTGTFSNFMNKYSQQQMQEKEALKQIFLTPLDYKDANGQPVKTSLMSYMISHGGQVPESLRPEIEKRFGTEIYRYFNTAGKAQ